MHEGGIEFEKYIATSHVDMKKAPAWHWEQTPQLHDGRDNRFHWL
jgi:hypothetical protein